MYCTVQHIGVNKTPGCRLGSNTAQVGMSRDANTCSSDREFEKSDARPPAPGREPSPAPALSMRAARPRRCCCCYCRCCCCLCCCCCVLSSLRRRHILSRPVIGRKVVLRTMREGRAGGAIRAVATAAPSSPELQRRGKGRMFTYVCTEPHSTVQSLSPTCRSHHFISL